MRFNRTFMDRRWAPRNTPELGGGAPAGGQPPTGAPAPAPLPPHPQNQLPPPAQTAPAAPQQPATDWKAEAIRLRAEKEAADRAQQSTQSEVAQLRAAWEADRAQAQLQIRQGQLIAYRNQLLAGMAHMPAAFHALVFGQTEEELYNRAQAAVAEFDRSQKEIEARIRQSMAGPAQVAPQGQPGIPPGFQPQGPQSPFMPQTQGFPSPAPHQGPGMNQPQIPVGQFANENGVRSGKWGQVRDEALNNLKTQLQGGVQPPPQFQGYGMPQQAQNVMPYAQMPGGVQQPSPAPSPRYAAPQVQNFGQWQQPYQQPQLPPPPQVQNAGNMAQEAQQAVERTLRGQNPTLGQTAGGAAALSQFQQNSSTIGAHTGQTPMGAFQARFAPNPSGG